MAIIYKHTSPSGKSYIGMTNQTIEERLKGHITESNKDKEKHYKFHYAIKKYGIENFKSEVLEECGNEFADEREKYWISYYDTFNNGYNMTEGGYGRSFGWTHTEESKEKMRVPKSPEHIEKMSLAQMGKIPWNKGLKLNDNQKNKGCPHTQQTKDLLSIMKTGTKHSEETKLKISFKSSGENNGMFGKNHTDETKAKMTEKRIDTKCVYNNDLKINKYVKKSDIQNYVDAGWVIGMKNFKKDLE